LKTVKKIAFPLFALFLAYRSVELIKQLVAKPSETYSIFELFVLAFLLTAFITGVFALPGFVFPTNRILASNYYKIRNPKVLKQVYTKLGIHHFRVVLLFAFWGKEKNRKKYFDGTRLGISNFSYQSRQSEFGHLISFVCIVLASAFLLAQGHLLLVLFASVINIVGNLFPVILQRYHRMRIERLPLKRLT
jgi:hypothetical protein